MDIKFQTSNDIFSRILRRYYDELPDRNKRLIKKTSYGSGFKPYLSNEMQIYDFIHWIDQSDPMIINLEAQKLEVFDDNRLRALLEIAYQKAIKFDLILKKNEFL